MYTTIRADDGVATLINIFTVEPENRDALIGLLKESTETSMAKKPGWISTNFLASRDGRRVVIYSQWRRPEDIDAMRQDPNMGPYLKKIAAIAKFEAMTCDVTYVHHA
jgi:quinol monooxygenase YgiN